jgi:hypothetical protein
MTAKFLKGSVALLVFGVLLSTGAAVCRAQYGDQSTPQPPQGAPAQNAPAKAPAP